MREAVWREVKAVEASIAERIDRRIDLRKWGVLEGGTGQSCSAGGARFSFLLFPLSSCLFPFCVLLGCSIDIED